jgi:diadenosine tetraphosphate (Ap4A) HIT family hydrolase
MSYLSCPFCNLENRPLLLSDEHVVAFADVYPVAEGHTLVVPRKHVASIYNLSLDEQSSVWNMVANVRDLLLHGGGSSGFTIGVNDGLTAGQTIEHAHVHVIPRRPGDVEDPRGGIRWVIPNQAKYWD